MTDPTPTRAEVEALLQLLTDRAPRDGIWTQQRQAADVIAALRERAEAAEAELALADKSPEYWHRRAKEAEAALNAARRAEAAAWNDAIEAGWAYIETCLDEPETDADAALISDMEEGFRALRRAAPTEGEA